MSEPKTTTACPCLCHRSSDPTVQHWQSGEICACAAQPTAPAGEAAKQARAKEAELIARQNDHEHVYRCQDCGEIGSPPKPSESTGDLDLMFAYLTGLFPVDSIAGQRLLRLKREVQALISEQTTKAYEAGKNAGHAAQHAKDLDEMEPEARIDELKRAKIQGYIQGPQMPKVDRRIGRLINELEEQGK